MPILKTVDYILLCGYKDKKFYKIHKIWFVVIAFNPTICSFNHARGRYQVVPKLPDKILRTNLVRNCYYALIDPVGSK
jgi:hypothetical protein